MNHENLEHNEDAVKLLVENIDNATDLQIVIDFGKKVIATTKENELAPECYHQLLAAVFRKIEKLTYELRIAHI